MLALNTIELKNFRNYFEFNLELDKNVTIVTGKNGIGKTNIVEAIELLTFLDSFRNPSWNEIIRWGQDSARANALISGDGRELVCSLLIEANRRHYRINGKNRNAGDIRGMLPSVLFTPDDLKLVKGSAEKRRAAIDLVGVQLSRTYAKIRSDYTKIIRCKNRLFKEDSVDRPILASWNINLEEVGSSFLFHRVRLFSTLVEEVMKVHRELVENESLSISYYPSWEKDYDSPEPAFQKALGEYSRDELKVFLEREIERRNEDEIIRRSCLVGPHRDEIVFYLNGRDARKYGSQGQVRTIALAWKIAEVRVISRLNDQQPILLLDDVMSELDEMRRSALMQTIDGNIQTVITTTNLQYFEPSFVKTAKVVDLEELLS